jgi:hypothetical protein
MANASVRIPASTAERQYFCPLALSSIKRLCADANTADLSVNLNYPESDSGTPYHYLYYWDKTQSDASGYHLEHEITVLSTFEMYLERMTQRTQAVLQEVVPLDFKGSIDLETSN